MSTGEAVTISLGGKEHAIPPLSADRGLQAAEMLIPFLVTLRPAIQEIAAAQAEGKEGRSYTEIGMEVAMAILPQLKAADILRLGQLLTGIDYDELAGAPLPETLEAIIVAGKAIDFSGLVATASKLMGMMGLGGTAPAPAVEAGGAPAETLARAPKG
ncbi:MAG: hypothetical protein MUO37_04915 [Methyloceanibacter sp.]|nr:hypothetical protein [Methyloceanibacter sp.]